LLMPALALALTLPATQPAWADAVSDAITAASTAYDGGDLKVATDQLALALQGLRQKQTDLLNAFVPAAPDGFTSEVNAEYAQGFALAGGGTGTEVTYSSDSASFRLDITVDNAMVASMAPMLANAQMMAAMGKVDQIGGVMVLEQDQSLSTLIDNRILVQMQGADVAVMLPVMQQMDLAGLAKFDHK
jgi:hypothetical protein